MLQVKSSISSEAITSNKTVKYIVSLHHVTNFYKLSYSSVYENLQETAKSKSLGSFGVEQKIDLILE